MSVLARDLDRFIRERIQVSESETIFTVFAFLNAAGYDDENNPRGMHRARVHVRRALARGLPREVVAKLRAFYHKREGIVTTHTYSVVSIATSGPPDFQPGFGWNDLVEAEPYRALTGLPPRLREFYRESSLLRIYEGIRGEYETASETYRDLIRREVRSAFSFCRVRGVDDLAGGGEIGRAVVIPNLLESYERALSFVWGGTLYSVEGPQRRRGYNPHEFIHSVTNPMSYDPQHAAEQRKADRIFRMAIEQPEIRAHFGRKSVQAFLDECLVRAVALKYRETGSPRRRAQLQRAVIGDYMAGYILIRFFWDQLDEFRRTKMSLREFYTNMLHAIDTDLEIERWRARFHRKGPHGRPRLR